MDEKLHFTCCRPYAAAGAQNCRARRWKTSALARREGGLPVGGSVTACQETSVPHCTTRCATYFIQPILMRIARHRGAARPDQKVQVGALVGLQYVVDVKFVVAAFGRLRCDPG